MADEGPIQLRVGASVDTSLAAATASTIAAMKRARQVAQSESEAAAAAQGKAADKAAKAAAKAYEQIVTAAEKASQKEQAAADKAAAAKGRAELKAFDAKLKASQRAADAYEKDLLREVAAAEKASARKAAIAEREARQAAKSAGADRLGFARGAARTFGGIAGAAGRLGMGIAKGAGVNLDIGSAVGSVVAQQKLASQISNSGYLEGDARNGVRQNATDIHHEARAAAMGAGISTDSALEGLQEMVGKSSDLATSRAILGDMAKLSAETGSSMADVGAAAGEVSLRLGDVPDKAKAVSGIMAVIAQQGKTGAIEMREMAKNLGTVMASAGKFGGGPEQAAKDLGALFQVAKKGGSKNAASAATGVSSFVAGLTNPAELKRLQGLGINVFDNAGLKKGDAGYNTKFAGIGQIAAAALFKTGGDLGKLGGLFKNQRAMSVVSGLGAIYGDAEKNKKGSGVDAIQKYMADMGKGMSDKDRQESLAVAMGTTASKATQFNTQLEALGEKLAGKVLPAMEQLAPAILALADVFTSLIGSAAQNPGEAITLAIVASIGKQAMGAALGKAIEGAVGSSLGTAGLVIGTAMLAAETVNLLSDAAHKRGAGKANESLDETVAQDRSAEKELATTGHLSPESRAALERRGRELKTRIDIASNPDAEDEVAGKNGGVGGFFKKRFAAIGDAVSPEAGEARGQAAQDKANLAAMIAELKGVRADLSADRNGVKKVHVTNPTAGGGHPGKTDSGKPDQ